MKVIVIIDILLVIIYIYFIFIHGYILGRRKFKCIRCGKCCSFRINLPKEDIERIRKAGYKDFLEKNNRLKKVNGYCIFMNLDNGITSCKLENSAKPKICRNFPYINGCFGRQCDFRCSSFWKFR